MTLYIDDDHPRLLNQDRASMLLFPDVYDSFCIKFPRGNEEFS